ncbi:dTMP kinase [Streptomyces sp. NPDC002476]|uniref:dTMP kinase n=1 Tax=Streptomyces sp. NPDC002476 TaxID=3364648 RepID=UPI0036AC5F1A
MTRRGRFISIDGPSGVGKSTTIRALHTELTRRGIAVHQTVEPTSSDLGRFIRGHFADVRGHALACLVAADRFEHVDHEIEPRLAAGGTVITDRYVASTLVMQRLDGVPLPYLLALTGPVLMPDLAVILTADPGLIAERIAARGPTNRFHRDPTAPGREVPLYEEAARALRTAGVPVLVVDTGTATPSEVAAAISGAVPDPSTTSPPSKPTMS